MSADLHTRLRAVIEERLTLAKALHDAAPGRWTVESGKYFWILDGDGDRLAEVGDAKDAAFIAAHGPDDAIRRHEAALQVLERHAVDPDTTHNNLGLLCCVEHPAAFPHPCPEIHDLAAAYGVPLDTEEEN